MAFVYFMIQLFHIIFWIILSIIPYFYFFIFDAICSKIRLFVSSFNLVISSILSDEKACQFQNRKQFDDKGRYYLNYYFLWSIPIDCTMKFLEHLERIKDEYNFLTGQLQQQRVSTCSIIYHMPGRRKICAIPAFLDILFWKRKRK